MSNHRGYFLSTYSVQILTNNTEQPARDCSSSNCEKNNDSKQTACVSTSVALQKRVDASRGHDDQAMDRELKKKRK